MLDTYCCAGGTGMGFHRAGLDVVGIDIADQPSYPFEFHQEEAINYLTKVIDNGMRLPDGRRVHAVSAGPPCQRYTTLAKGCNHNTEDHPDLIPATRELLQETGVPWVLENVPSAPLVDPTTLCGEMFGLGVIRHRKFETNWALPQPAHVKHRGRVAGYRHGEWFTGPYCAVYGDGGGKGTLAEWKVAMQIDWMKTKAELVESIPPAYTAHIGAAMLAVL
jgi:hypothetical protein